MRALAQHRGDGALQIAHARLAGVAVDDLIQRRGRHRDAPLQAVVFQLLGQQVALGDVEFFGAGIAGQLNDVHTVVQGTGNGRGIVGGGDEQHLAQIKRYIEIIILKGAVLLRVQHLQQCAGGVALVVARQLVDLVQQDHGVCALGGDHGADDASGHCADVGAAVSADLRLVMYAAQTHAGKFAPHAVCDRVRNARFAHARRSDQAEDLPLDVIVQLAHRQNFQDALLDLLHTVMLLIQHLARVRLVQIILGRGVPRQGQAGVQIIADHAAFGGAALHTRQTVALFQQFFGSVRLQLQFLDLAAVPVRLGAGVLGVAQLLADDVHLLAQVVFALSLVHLRVDLFVQVALNFQNLAFLPQQGQQLFQPGQQAGFVQDGLLILVLQQQVGGHILAQKQRIIGRNDVVHHILGQLRAEGKVLLKAVLQAAHQRLALGALVGGNAPHGCRAHRCLQIFALGFQFQQAGAGLALDQYLDQIVGHAQRLLDVGDHAVGIQILAVGVFGVHLLLGNQKHTAVAVHGSLNGGDGFFAPHLKMYNVIGKHHQPAQGNDRQMHHIAGDFDFYFFGHLLILLWSVIRGLRCRRRGAAAG